MDNQPSRGPGSLFLAIIITAIVVAGGMYLWQQYAPEKTQQENEVALNELDELKDKVENLQNEIAERDSTEEVAMPDTEPVPVETTTAENISSDIDANIETRNTVGYKNEKFGFSVELPEEYKGFKAKVYDDSVHFFVDSEGTTWPYDTFDVFTINAFSHAWWEENNVRVKDEILLGGKEGDKVAFIPGINDPTGSLGGYLGKNNTYYFTFGRGHDCPGNTLNPDEFTWQCELFRNVPQALRDFDVFDI